MVARGLSVMMRNSVLLDSPTFESEHPRVSISPQGEARTLVRDALASLEDEAGDPVLALARLNRAETLDPTCVDTSFRLAQGLLLLHHHRDEAAHLAFRQARELEPEAIDRELGGHSVREAWLEALCRVATNNGDGEAAREAEALVGPGTSDAQRARVQRLRAHLPWNGSLLGLLPPRARPEGPEGQPVFNDQAPGVGDADQVAPLLALSPAVEDLLAARHAEALERALAFLGGRRRWSRDPRGALGGCQEADFLALAVAGHALLALGRTEEGIACLRAVVAQSPWLLLFHEGTRHTLQFAGRRLQHALQVEHPELRYERSHSLTRLVELLAPHERRSWWGRLLGR